MIPIITIVTKIKIHLDAGLLSNPKPIPKFLINVEYEPNVQEVEIEQEKR